MGFFEYHTQCERAYKGTGVSPDHKDFCNHIRKKQLRSPVGTLADILCVMEMEWVNNCRPYYKVWPSIMSTLIKLNLDVPVNSICFPVSELAIRMSTPLTINDENVEAILIKTTDKLTYKKTPGARLLVTSTQYDDCLTPAVGSIALLPGETVNDSLNRSVENSSFKVSTFIDEVRIVLKLVCTIGLLSNDPSIIQPDVLSKDRCKFDNTDTPETQQRLIDKAAKRGVVGWRLGEQYETCPHYRRPHFGWRHTGKGRKLPKYVPIKGAIVHRKKITEVPTGYMTPDGKEIET